MTKQQTRSRLRRLTPAIACFTGLLLLSGMTPSLSNQQPPEYVGLRYFTLPAGLQGRGNWTINSDNGNSIWAVSEVIKGSQRMLWLETLVAYDSTGKPQYRVIDVLTLPQLAASDDIAGGSGYYCRINGKYDPELVMIAKTESDTVEYIKQIRKAWRANRSTGRFEGITPRNIVCENPGFGV